MDPLSARDNFRRERSKQAFTLVELLSTIAVLATLAALIAPVLAKGHAQSRSAACSSNLRQIGFALRQYADADPAGRLPPDPSIPSPYIAPITNTWFDYLGGYLSTNPAVRLCPADRLAALRLVIGHSSYLRNAYCALDLADADRLYAVPDPSGEPLPAHQASLQIDSYPRPADTYLTFETSNANAAYASPATPPVDCAFPSTWDAGWWHVLADIDPKRHGQGANYLFADFHTEKVPARVLRARIEANDNFATIQQ